MDPNRVCPNCLKEMPQKGEECPFCGYEEGTRALSARCLPPYTVLQGRYFVGTVIGEGGFGITYRAWDLTDNLKVAIKEFFPVGLVTRDTSHGGDNTVQSISGQLQTQYRNSLQKYENEARCLMKLRGLPGIVNILNFFHENSTAYIVMEFLEGMTMREYLVRNQGCLPEQKALEMMRPLMYSLDSIHRAGIVHRDISPDNIIVQPDEKLKLIDFGAARQSTGNQTMSLTVVLKHGYAPEEQYRSQGKQGPFTDVYALCATLYKILTGITPVEALARMFEDELKPLHQFPNKISSQTCVAITKGMAVRAAERYQTVSELAAALYENRPKLIPAGSNVPVQPKKKLWPIFAGSALLVAILGIIFWPKTRYTFEISPEPVVGNYRYEIHSNIPELDKVDIQWTLQNVRKDGETVDAPVLNELNDQSAVVQEGWDYTFNLVASCQYQGKTYADIFTHSEPPLKSMEILNLPEKTEYQLGETVDLAGMNVNLSYSNGEEITAGADETAFLIIPEVLEESGTQTITIQQGDKTATFEVTVTDPRAEEEKANADAYAEAVKLKDKGSYTEAKVAFEALGDYSDAKEQANACQNALDDITAKETAASKKAEQDAWEAAHPRRVESEGGMYFLYEYYPNGAVKTQSSHNSDGSEFHRFEYEYDGAGRTTKETVYISGVIDYVREFDAFGHATKYHVYKKGELVQVTECDYNAAGQETKSRVYEPDGTLKLTWDYEYNAVGQKIKATQYWISSGITWVIMYDENGNEISNHHYIKTENVLD